MDGATLKQQRLAHQQDKLSTRVIDAAVTLPDDLEAELKAGCESVMPVVNDEVRELMIRHIKLTMEFGTDVEKACYNEQIFGGLYDSADPITDEHIKRLVARLINKRPAAFLTSGDKGVLRDGAGFKAATHDFTNIQNLGPEKGHFCLKEYISYDEMKLAAFVHASAKTPFMNDGRRDNKGADERTKPDVIKSGVVIGSVGARFERPNLMEWQDMIVCVDAKIPGERLTGDAVQYRARQRAMWDEFYGIQKRPTVEEAKQDTSGRFIKIEDDDEGRPQYLDGVVYKRMIKMRLAAVLQEANERAKEDSEGKKAYVHLAGLGLGVWQKSSRQNEIFYDSVVELLQELDLPNVADVDLSWIEGNQDRHPLGTAKEIKGIQLRNTKNDPSKSDKNKEGKLLVQDVAWDANSFGGNEYRLGKSYHAASGDPAAASSAPVFAEGFNEALNPALAVDKIKVRRVGATTKKAAPVVVPDPEVAVVDPVVMEQGIRSRLQALARRLDRECLFDGRKGVEREERSDRISLKSGAYYEYGLTQYGTAYISYFDFPYDDKKTMREHLIGIDEVGVARVFLKIYKAVEDKDGKVTYEPKPEDTRILSAKDSDAALKEFFDKQIFANESKFLNQRIGKIKQSRLNAQYLEQMRALKAKYAGKLTAGKAMECVIDGEQHEIGINRKGGFYVEKIMPLDPQGVAEEHNRHSHVLILTADEKNVWFHSRREKYVDAAAGGRRGAVKKEYSEMPIDDIRHHGINLEVVKAELGKPPVEHLPDASVSAAASTTTPKRDLARSMVAKAKELGIKKWVSDLDGTLLRTHTVHNKDIAAEFFDGVYARGATTASYKLKDAKKSEAAVAKLFADLELLKEILAACKDEGIEFHVATRQYSWIAEDILKAAGIGEDLLPKDRVMGVENFLSSIDGRSEKALAVDRIALIPSADPSAVPTYDSAIYMDDMAKEFTGMRDEVVMFVGGRDLPQYADAGGVALENASQKTTNGVEAVGFGFNAVRAKSFDAQLAKMIRARDQALAAAAIKAEAPAQIAALTQKMHDGCGFSADETISFPAPTFFKDDETNFYSIHHDGKNLIVSLHVVARGIDHRYSVKINDGGEAVFVFNPSRDFAHDHEQPMLDSNCIKISELFDRDIFSGRNLQLDHAIQDLKAKKVHAQIRAEDASLGQTSLRFKRLAALRNDNLNDDELGGKFDIRISGEGDESGPVDAFFQATVRDEDAIAAVRGSIYEFQFAEARLFIPQDRGETIVVDASNEARFSDILAKVDAAIEQEAILKSRYLAKEYYERCAGVYGESESFYLSLDGGFRVLVYKDRVEIHAAASKTTEDGQPEFALVTDKDVYCEKLGKVSEFAERTLQIAEQRKLEEIRLAQRARPLAMEEDLLAAARRGDPRGRLRFTMVGDTEDYASPPRRVSMPEEDAPRTARRGVSFRLPSSPDSPSVSVAPEIAVPAGIILEEVSDKRRPTQHTALSAAKEKMPQVVKNDKTATVVPYESIDGGVKDLAEAGVFSKAVKRLEGRQPYNQSAVIKEMYESPIKTLYLREPTEKDGRKISYSFADDKKKYVTTNSAAYNDFFRSFAKKDLFDIDLSAVTQDSRFTNCSLRDGCALPKGADWINKNTFSNCEIKAGVLSVEQVAKVEKLFGKDVVRRDGEIVIPQQEREMINEKPRGSCVPMPIKQFKALPLAASAATRGSVASV